jgi:hypothetical protein
MSAFEVTPPAHVWQGVVSGLESHQASKSNTTKKVIIWTAAALLLALVGWLLLSPSNGVWVENQHNEIVTLAVAEDNLAPEETKVQEKPVENNSSVAVDAKPSFQIIEVSEINEPIHSDSKPYNYSAQEEIANLDNQIVDHRSIYSLAFLSFEDFTQLNLHTAEPTLLFRPYGQTIKGFCGPDQAMSAKDKSIKQKGRWSAFVGVSSEFISSPYDSVTILNTYSLGVEPIYHFNKHWFVRFGLGVSSSRDRGFAKLDYISSEYKGSYNDVYDITFDSIDNQIVPTYHTKTVEVWDSIRHLVVSEVTNRYAYVQIPLMFGYYHAGSKLGVNWYVFGGPTFNFQLGQWIDEPHPAESYVEILDLQNRLPERSRFYTQLCLTAGIEYKISDNISMAIEPGYRYYVNSIYNKEGYDKPLSAFSLRVGAIIRLK